MSRKSRSTREQSSRGDGIRRGLRTTGHGRSRELRSRGF
jgi:hypothetical protein